MIKRCFRSKSSGVEGIAVADNSPGADKDETVKKKLRLLNVSKNEIANIQKKKRGSLTAAAMTSKTKSKNSSNVS